MKNILLLSIASLFLFCSCTKTKTNIVTITNYDTIYTYARTLWVDADNTGLTLSFTKDSIYETLPSYSQTPFGYGYSISHDTINIPSKSIQVIITVTKDSMFYNDFKGSVTTHFYRD